MLNHKKWMLFCLLSLSCTFLFSGCGKQTQKDVLTLRICNWEEYIDEGGWDEDEAIELEDTTILGKNNMIDDFTDWYERTTGQKIKVEYSCFGSNEELYNQLTLGDEFDLVCPSEYMIMKLLAENELEPLSDSFFDTSKEENYYSRGAASYIKDLTSEIQINGQSIDKYAAGYMWGTTGIVYNPEFVTAEEASSFSVLTNPKFKCQVTIKDNVRDSYFAAVSILKKEKLLDLRTKALTSSQSTALNTYHEQLHEEMNDTSKETIAQVETLLQNHKDHFYSFESDSGKADMITGKVVANYQWSGDAVYTLDQAEEDESYLCYAVPEESSNLWFDGWVMLKDGIAGDAQKKAAAEAFMNYVSMPENVVRNMYYIGYTSAIAGGEDDTIFQYANWCYASEDETNETVEYDLQYFFGSANDPEKKYCITADKDQAYRQLYAQYPPSSVLQRCAVMDYFGAETNKALNQMWINVRCFNPFRK